MERQRFHRLCISQVPLLESLYVKIVNLSLRLFEKGELICEAFHIKIALFIEQLHLTFDNMVTIQ